MKKTTSSGTRLRRKIQQPLRYEDEVEDINYRKPYLKRNGTKPEYPELLAAQTVPFNPCHRPAAFPSLPLTGDIPAAEERTEYEVDANEVAEEIESDVVSRDTSEEVHEPVDKAKESHNSKQLGRRQSPSRRHGKLIQWRGLELAYRYRIFCTISHLQGAHKAGLWLGLLPEEFNTMLDAHDWRKRNPLTLQQIHDSRPRETDCFEPEFMVEHLDYMVRISHYELGSPQQLAKATQFLIQRNLPVELLGTWVADPLGSGQLVQASSLVALYPMVHMSVEQVQVMEDRRSKELPPRGATLPGLDARIARNQKDRKAAGTISKAKPRSITDRRSHKRSLPPPIPATEQDMGSPPVSVPKKPRANTARCISAHTTDPDDTDYAEEEDQANRVATSVAQKRATDIAQTQKFREHQLNTPASSPSSGASTGQRSAGSMSLRNRGELKETAAMADLRRDMQFWGSSHKPGLSTDTTGRKRSGTSTSVSTEGEKPKKVVVLKYDKRGTAYVESSSPSRAVDLDNEYPRNTTGPESLVQPVSAVQSNTSRPATPSFLAVDSEGVELTSSPPQPSAAFKKHTQQFQHTPQRASEYFEDGSDHGVQDEEGDTFSTPQTSAATPLVRRNTKDADEPQAEQDQDVAHQNSPLAGRRRPHMDTQMVDAPPLGSAEDDVLPSIEDHVEHAIPPEPDAGDALHELLRILAVAKSTAQNPGTVESGRRSPERPTCVSPITVVDDDEEDRGVPAPSTPPERALSTPVNEYAARPSLVATLKVKVPDAILNAEPVPASASRTAPVMFTNPGDDGDSSYGEDRPAKKKQKKKATTPKTKKKQVPQTVNELPEVSPTKKPKKSAATKKATMTAPKKATTAASKKAATTATPGTRKRGRPRKSETPQGVPENIGIDADVPASNSTTEASARSQVGEANVVKQIEMPEPDADIGGGVTVLPSVEELPQSEKALPAEEVSRAEIAYAEDASRVEGHLRADETLPTIGDDTAAFLLGDSELLQVNDATYADTNGADPIIPASAAIQEVEAPAGLSEASEIAAAGPSSSTTSEGNGNFVPLLPRRSNRLQNPVPDATTPVADSQKLPRQQTVITGRDRFSIPTETVNDEAVDDIESAQDGSTGAVGHKEARDDIKLASYMVGDDDFANTHTDGTAPMENGFAVDLESPLKASPDEPRDSRTAMPVATTKSVAKRTTTTTSPAKTRARSKTPAANTRSEANASSKPGKPLPAKRSATSKAKAAAIAARGKPETKTKKNAVAEKGSVAVMTAEELPANDINQETTPSKLQERAARRPRTRSQSQATEPLEDVEVDAGAMPVKNHVHHRPSTRSQTPVVERKDPAEEDQADEDPGDKDQSQQGQQDENEVDQVANVPTTKSIHRPRTRSQTSAAELQVDIGDTTDDEDGARQEAATSSQQVSAQPRSPTPAPSVGDAPDSQTDAQSILASKTTTTLVPLNDTTAAASAKRAVSEPTTVGHRPVTRSITPLRVQALIEEDQNEAILISSSESSDTESEASVGQPIATETTKPRKKWEHKVYEKTRESKRIRGNGA
ncbi:uncharacterized protein AB675_6836 [Cyphellophora attinorum]|uniref:Uncharacterized protein n=1 Tax=Cyphellophora attinorum TaxID=1664694 RepID=A0A0N1HYQ1_9EURO|nr:uncharacterized protein AB675_6836 [Phialophora attinorum]KPI43660.1 hypothetical protein AB675_6836 [Phialophora attinorum]